MKLNLSKMNYLVRLCEVKIFRGLKCTILLFVVTEKFHRQNIFLIEKRKIIVALEMQVPNKSLEIVIWFLRIDLQWSW